MSKLLKASSIVAAVFAAGLASANAADLDRALLAAPLLPVTKPVEVGTGWYLRGDLGYSISTSSGGPSMLLYNGMGTYGSTQLNSDAISSDWSGSAGFGYHFNDWLRTDLTVEYTKGAFDQIYGGACSAQNPVGNCALNQDFKGWGFMANGYVDLGTYAGITPYVGAGAGMMSVNWDTLSLQCVNSPACAATGTSRGEHDWRFAYQLSAGLAYAITKNLKLDVGYRYFDVAGGKMFDFNGGDQALGATGVQGRDHGFSKSEIRAGLRYDIW